MPRGVSEKRERQYRNLKSKFEKSGRYKGREEEVASRIVNKQRAQLGETKGAQRKASEGKSPDRGLPIRNYMKLTISEIGKKLSKLSNRELRQIKTYEQSHKNRKTLMNKINSQIQHA